MVQSVLKPIYRTMARYKPKRIKSGIAIMGATRNMRLQPVNATHALNLSAGVSNFNVSRGLSFN